MSDKIESLQGARVFLVEDEALVAMLIEDMLADHGCEIAATAARLGEALTIAENQAVAFDVAILDLNLAGEATFPVAAALKARGAPFVFATGYGAGGLPAEWRDRPTLQKPFTPADVADVLSRLLQAV